MARLTYTRSLIPWNCVCLSHERSFQERIYIIVVVPGKMGVNMNVIASTIANQEGEENFLKCPLQRLVAINVYCALLPSIDNIKVLKKFALRNIM